MISVNKESCTGCGLCVSDCFPRSLTMEQGIPTLTSPIDCLQCGHCQAICPTASIVVDEYNQSEVIEYSPDSFTIEPERLLSFIRFRRTIRRYKDKPLDKARLEAIIQAGRYTPTARNFQKTRYIVLQDRLNDFKDIVMKCLEESGQSLMEDGKGDEATAIGKRLFSIASDYFTSSVDRLFFNAPAVIIVASPKHLQNDAASAACSMELMANALGLGMLYSGYTVSVCGNPAIRDFLGLELDYVVVRCLVTGYPDVSYRRTALRKAPDISWM